MGENIYLYQLMENIFSTNILFIEQIGDTKCTFCLWKIKPVDPK